MQWSVEMKSPRDYLTFQREVRLKKSLIILEAYSKC